MRLPRGRSPTCQAATPARASVRQKKLLTLAMDIGKKRILWDGVVCPETGAGSIAVYGPPVHGGLGRGRRPRAPAPWSGASTIPASPRSRPWNAASNPRAAACVRFSAAFVRTVRVIKSSTPAPPGRSSIRAAVAGLLRLRAGARDRLFAQARAARRVQGAGHLGPSSSDGRELPRLPPLQPAADRGYT
jgi:hypothetical protein